jgi:Virulence-associated protein E/Bifunctional DNA primase/polymerase, N-terminal
MTTPLADAASYAEHQGWSIIPLKPRGKVPLLKDWTNQASDDPAIIEAWAEQHPGANAGAVTGKQFFVLDVDPQTGGVDTLAALVEVYGPLPKTLTQRTGSGGFHYLFQIPDFAVHNSAGKLGKGLDIRGIGGQIVVPPSVTEKGPYAWIDASPVAPAPEWLLALLRPRAVEPDEPVAPRREFPAASPDDLEAARAFLESRGPAIEGQGGDEHTWQVCAGLMNDFALTEGEAWPLLVEWNQTCRPPWSESQLASKMRGGLQYAKGAYGSKRQLDTRTMIQQIIDSAAGSGVDTVALVERVKPLFKDLKPGVDYEIALDSVKRATGLRLGVLKTELPDPRRAQILEVRKGEPEYQRNPTTGAPNQTLANVCAYLKHHNYPVVLDLFLNKVVDAQSSLEWTDAHSSALALKIQQTGGLNKIPTSIVTEAVMTWAREHSVDHLETFLRTIQWDGVRRVQQFFQRGFGVADSEYVRAVSENFLRSLVARPLNPGCKVDTMVVLEGVQGARKSTGLKALVGAKYFAEASESPHDKDFFLTLQGKLLVEIAELDAFGRADVTAVKRVLSCAIDRFRPPYGRLTEDFPRRGIFAGTTNRDDWAKDDTGGRRFWPLRCSAVDVEWVEENRLQLLAEAVHEVTVEDLPWWIVPASAAVEQADRRQEDPWEEQIVGHVNGSTEVRIVDVLDAIGIPVERRTRAELLRVASVLRHLGYTRATARTRGDVVKVWRLNG